MLVQFSVENYRSFKERATLSMVRAKPDKALPHNVTARAQSTNLDLLRSVVVYGANASGKSNLLRALRFAARFVTSSHQEGHTGKIIDARPFMLEPTFPAKPSTFEFVLLVDGVQYVYGFSTDLEMVRKEWLSAYPLGQERVLFERSQRDGEPDVSISFGSSWKGEQARLKNLTRQNALFLSVAAQFNHKMAQPVFTWFVDRFREVSWFPAGGTELMFTCDSAQEHPDKKSDIFAFVQHADSGILDFHIKKIPLRESPDWQMLPEEIKKMISSRAEHDPYVLNIATEHRGLGTDGTSSAVRFDLDEESDGTKKMFALAAPWWHVLQNGCVLVVDELDARLHPKLTKWLIHWFHSDELNPHGAQLIFATHDDNLMQSDLFRRDQIWFTEKGEDGASKLYSLWDFKKPPRRETNIRRGYLSGRYGAVPFLEELPK